MVTVVYNEDLDPLNVIGFLYVVGEDGVRREVGRIVIAKAEWPAFKAFARQTEFAWGFN